MGRTERSGQVLARAAAREEKSAAHELAPRVEIKSPAASLRIGRIRPTLIWPFLPANSQPAQVFNGGLGKIDAAAIGVQVFHAHDERAARVTRPLAGRPESACVAHVQIASG